MAGTAELKARPHIYLSNYLNLRHSYVLKCTHSENLFCIGLLLFTQLQEYVKVAYSFQPSSAVPLTS